MQLSIISQTCLFLCCALFLHGAVAKENKLNYLVINELSVPFQLVEGDKSSGGLVTEIVEEAAKRADYKLNYIVGSNDRVETIIQYGLQQPWIGYTAKVWKSLRDYMRYLEVPLFEVSHSLLTCDSQITAVPGVTHLRGKHLAILKSFDYPELTPLARNGELSLTNVRSYRQGFDLLRHLRVNGFVEMDLRLKYNLGTLAAKDDCMRFIDLKHVIPTFHIYLAVSRDLDENTVRKLEKTLEGMRQDDTIKDIVKRYNQY